ncbi:MAG TPA: trypsin-like peptidase domain-containing protein [Anaerolineales bacterium]|nr:trypsin-like peptidase domain-containing protein [Anaerolineales bacterium]HND91569.1 trypsin-like peptidase domain-containing protein [Anaerolineales bacterium]HNH06831.1 trypsin-like peptidase domain-containing protein [Anaerolineales bacterium]
MNESSASKMDKWKGRMREVIARLRRGLPFASGVFGALLVLFFYNLLVVKPNQLTVEDVNASVAMVMASATPAPSYSAQVYQIIRPSLILIQVEEKHQNAESDFGLGSGVVVDSFGNILTSLHVVDGASVITVTFADGTQSEAAIVSEMPERDIAVLQAYDTPLSVVPAVLGNPNSMRVGDEAFVVGNPFGLYSSMSSGVISGFDRVFQMEGTGLEIPGMIQIDAAVNPGNSGGPLLNRNGHVIGIVTGIINPTDESFFVGIGFAVPITVAVGGMGSPPY